MIENIAGWGGSILLAICALPQAIESYKNKHANGITHGLLWCWMIGEFLTLLYLLLRAQSTGDYDVPLIVNYATNIFLVAIIMKYKYFPMDVKSS
jgi:uncharacterized protein with PQ loop repeat